MRTYLAIIAGKLIRVVCTVFGLGAGGTWPGEIALKVSPLILSTLASRLDKGIVVVAGTNGKTTTAMMIKQILQESGATVLHNSSGANLLNGIVSTFIHQMNWLGNFHVQWGVFEIDEASLPQFISKIKYQKSNIQSKNKKLIVTLLNLFRDQLDRYGEVDVIAEKWTKTLSMLPEEATVVLNADDAGIVGTGEKIVCKKVYFGIQEKSLLLSKIQHAVDSVFCPRCGNRLKFEGTFFSHLGHWKCIKCKAKRPAPNVFEGMLPLPGVYNRYNTYAAIATTTSIGIDTKLIDSALTHVSPAFGRQEELTVAGKKIKIFLSKNPTGFNETLRTALSMRAKNILLILNDRIPDGRDVSWIWDVDFEILGDSCRIVVSGDRCYDLAVRMKYSSLNQKANIKNQKYKLKIKKKEPFTIKPHLDRAVNLALSQLGKDETLYILPTYSAMLEVRKLITGRKIL